MNDNIFFDVARPSWPNQWIPLFLVFQQMFSHLGWQVWCQLGGDGGGEVVPEAMWPSHKADLGDEGKRTVIENCCQRQRRSTFASPLSSWPWWTSGHEGGRDKDWIGTTTNLDLTTYQPIKKASAFSGPNWPAVSHRGWTESLHHFKTLSSFSQSI